MQLSVEVNDQYQKVDFDFLKVTFVREGYDVKTVGLEETTFLKGLWVHFAGGEPLFLEGFTLTRWADLKKSLVFQLQTQIPQR